MVWPPPAGLLTSTLCQLYWYLLGWPGQLRALSNSSIAPFFFFNFFTNESTAFSAHFSSSSPCFQPSRRFTAGLVKENRDVMEAEEFIVRWINGVGCKMGDVKCSTWGQEWGGIKKYRGKDKRGSVMSPCKQRLLFFLLFLCIPLLLPSSAHKRRSWTPASAGQKLNLLSGLAQNGSGSSALEKGSPHRDRNPGQVSNTWQEKWERKY